MSPTIKNNRDEAQVPALVSELRPALVAFFHRRCKNNAEAEDLAQDVIVGALGRAEWTSEAEAKSYIFRAAMNRWTDRVRRTAVRGASVSILERDAEDAEGSPENVLASREELFRVVTALSELNERTRDIFLLCRLDHVKQGEVAEAFGISVSAVEKHVGKALRHLVARMHGK